MRKKIQLLRNENVYTPSEGKTALDNAKTVLSNVVLNDGEIVIGRYQENNENVKTVLGIKHNIEADGQENPVEGMTFFTNSDNFVSKPVVLYQTNGTTGLLGVNPSQLGNDWQLENYDFSPYKYLRCYFKMGNFSTNGVELTPSMVVELPLDIESKSKSAGDSTQEEPKTACDMYIAGGMSPNPSDPSNAFSVLVAVDSTKTKFQVINQMMYDEYQYDNTYGNSETPANNNGRFLYKIEGCYDTLNNSSTSEFVENDPVFTASPAYRITSADIDNWNSMVSGGGITGITMNGSSKGTSGVVDLGTVVTEETDPTVPSWAKASAKPTYTASEVGAVPTTRTVNGKALTDNITLTAEDVGALPSSTVIPTKVSELTNDSGFTTNTGTITGIKMNGSSKGTSGVVDLGTVLTSHQDISGKADKSAAIGSLSLALDSTNYKITLSGTKVDGTSFTVSNVIDLPLESVVVNGSYDNTAKKVVLTLQNGSTIDFSVADLVAGLQSEITSTNKLSADLISDGNTNKTVTATEKSTWNGKQDALSNANVLSGITSTKVSNWDSAATNSHTHSNKSVLDGIKATDITNWNSKTDNVGTVTGVKMNGTTKNPTSGVVNLGTVITSETALSKGSTSGSGNAVTEITVSGHQITLTKGKTFLESETQLSKGTTSGNGNAVTDISVSGHEITLTKGSTFLTSHQTLKTINSNSIVGSGNLTINELPTVTSSDNGKILMVVNGAWALVNPTTIYTGSGTPSSGQGNNGDIYLQTS